MTEPTWDVTSTWLRCDSEPENKVRKVLKFLRDQGSMPPDSYTTSEPFDMAFSHDLISLLWSWHRFGRKFAQMLIVMADSDRIECRKLWKVLEGRVICKPCVIPIEFLDETPDQARLFLSVTPESVVMPPDVAEMVEAAR